MDLIVITKSIWDVSTNSVILAGSVGRLMKDNLNATAITRIVYDGRSVLAVTQPVTVGTNHDKSGRLWRPRIKLGIERLSFLTLPV